MEFDVNKNIVDLGIVIILVSGKKKQHVDVIVQTFVEFQIDVIKRRIFIKFRAIFGIVSLFSCVCSVFVIFLWCCPLAIGM